jgi:hypothetical protein
MLKEVCFDAATEGATGGMLGLLPTRLCSKAKGHARCNGRPSVASEKTQVRSERRGSGGRTEALVA